MLLSDADLQEMLQPLANKVMADFYAATINAVANFYGDYTPTFYKRRGGLWNIWQNPNVYNIQNGLRVCFRFSSGGIGHDNESVFQTAFITGAHGTDKYFRGGEGAPITLPSPWDMIRLYCASYSL